MDKAEREKLRELAQRAYSEEIANSPQYMALGVIPFNRKVIELLDHIDALEQQIHLYINDAEKADFLRVARFSDGWNSYTFDEFLEFRKRNAEIAAAPEQPHQHQWKQSSPLDTNQLPSWECECGAFVTQQEKPG